MTKKKKQELRQLLNEAVKEENLEIRYGSEPVSLPIDVYRNYLQERWASYGVDFLSFSLWTPLTPIIVDETTKSKLFEFIRWELILFIEEDDIIGFLSDTVPAASYTITSDSTGRFRLDSCHFSRVNLYRLMERLLKIAIGKGIEEAVSFFDRYSCSEGIHDVFHMVTLIEGIELKTEIKVFEGVRLVPLPSSEIPEQFAQYLPGLLSYALMDQANEFYGNALLVVDDPGFSILHKPVSGPGFPRGLPVEKLPFQFEAHDVKCPNFNEEVFYQALSLVCNTSVQMIIGEWIAEPDKSLVLDDGITGLNMFLDPFDDLAEVEEADIKKATCLYNILINLDSKSLEKLQISIDRWIRSKKSENDIDKMIDLGIAFETLYVPDSNRGEIGFKLAARAAWHLGKDKKDRKERWRQIKQIYNQRSKVVHSGQPDRPIKFGADEVSIFEFIKESQNLCRDSIMKVLNARRFPDWSSLIIGGEAED